MIKDVKIEHSWKSKLAVEFSKEYMRDLSKFLKEEKAKRKSIYPPSNFMFRAFDLTKFEDVKVVILGQDPYHGYGQANGLSFSVGHGVKIPPSLQNIYKELSNDMGFNIPKHGNLEKWACQGVLLLNSVLSVEQNKPNSHANLGWEVFTDTILKKLNEYRKHIVYIFWGKKAQDKCEYIDIRDNLVIKSAHPSPYSANNGFFNSKPFSKTNDYLIEHDKEIIDWSID
jgi:uracil-DNA glycosylase